MSHARKAGAGASTAFRTRAAGKLRAGIRVLLAVALVIGGGVAFTAPAFASGPNPPSPPRLTLVRATDTSVVLHIDLVDNADPATVFTVTASPGPIVVDDLPVGDDTVPGLTPDTAYTFTATASDTAGTSPASSPLAVNTTAAAAPIPGPPTNLQVTLGGGRRLDVAWDPPEEGADLVTGYEVSAVEWGGWAVFTAPAEGTSYSFDSSGTPYTIVVRCLYDNDGTQRSDPVSAIAPALPPDQTPSAPTLSTLSVGRTSAVLHIDPSASDGGLPITGYTLSGKVGYQAPSAVYPSDVQLDNLSPGDVIVTGLWPKQVYTFSVTAHNTYYTSAASVPVTITTTGPGINEPGPPANLQLTLGADRQLNVAWDPPDVNPGLVEGYKVSAQVYGLTSTAVVTGTSFAFDGQPGAVYAISVQAVYSGGTQLSQPVTATAPAIPVPPTVPDAPGLALTSSGSGQVQLSITAPVNDGGSAITGYTIVDGLHGIHQAAGAGINTVTGLTNGVAYTFTAVAANSAGSSEASAAVTVMPTGVPAAPKLSSAAKWYSLQAVVAAPTTNGGSPITGYALSLARTGMPTRVVEMRAPGTVSFTGLSAHTGYVLRVVARNALGTSAATTTQVSTTPLPAPRSIPKVAVPMTAGESQILSGAGLFATGSATPSAAALREIMVLAHELAGVKAIQCAGYTDLDGGPLANYLVGLARAQTVCWVLRVDGVRATAATVSYGQSRPATTGANRELNRRVVITAER